MCALYHTIMVNHFVKPFSESSACRVPESVMETSDFEYIKHYKVNESTLTQVFFFFYPIRLFFDLRFSRNSLILTQMC